MVLSISHDTWCPHSCMTAQKVSYLAPLCSKILAGVLGIKQSDSNSNGVKAEVNLKIDIYSVSTYKLKYWK